MVIPWNMWVSLAAMPVFSFSRLFQVLRLFLVRVLLVLFNALSKGLGHILEDLTHNLVDSVSTLLEVLDLQINTSLGYLVEGLDGDSKYSSSSIVRYEVTYLTLSIILVLNIVCFISRVRKRT